MMLKSPYDPQIESKLASQDADRKAHLEDGFHMDPQALLLLQSPAPYGCYPSSGAWVAPGVDAVDGNCCYGDVRI